MSDLPGVPHRSSRRTTTRFCSPGSQRGDAFCIELLRNGGLSQSLFRKLYDALNESCLGIQLPLNASCFCFPAGGGGNHTAVSINKINPFRCPTGTGDFTLRLALAALFMGLEHASAESL